MDRPKVGVSALVIKDGQILLGKRKGSHGAGTWCIPGGHLEYGETIEEGAARELLEETGLKALSIRCAGWTNNIFEENKHYISFFAHIDRFEGEIALLEPNKCEGWHWFPLNALPSPLFDSLASYVLEKKLQPHFSLSVLSDRFAICRLDPSQPIPTWSSTSPFFSISKTSEELSIVCLENCIPEGIKSEKGWRAFKVAGPLDFSLTGILASLSKPLAEGGISIFAISTFDTDYLLVKQENLPKSIEILSSFCKIQLLS